MKVLLPALGSAGDIHPFLAIGCAMKARGHTVEIMTNPVFAGVVQDNGLDFYPLGLAEHYASAVRSSKFWHPVHGLGVLWRYMAGQAVEQVYHRIAEHAATDRCVVMTTPLMLGARVANEKLGVPLVTAYTAATMLRSTKNPLTIAQWKIPFWMPEVLRKKMWQALDKFKLEPMVWAQLTALRSELGLPALSGSVFGEWVHSPQAGVTLFPEWFIPTPADWPRQVRRDGFPLYEGDVSAGLDSGLLGFLDDGEAPIVFTQGTAQAHARAFFAAAVRSCHEMGKRGVLLTTDTAQIPLHLPPHVYHCRYAPFKLLLPRVAALVHHGGIGTAAQALKAGIPQLLTPSGYDQFDNAMRLKLLGVGDSAKAKDSQYRDMQSRLNYLLTSPQVAMACKTAAARIAQDTAPRLVCELLESFQ